jgi:hypothetical protein
MDKPISVGDLVMVVRGHECVVAKVGGVPYTVEAIVPQMFGGWYCPVCDTENHGTSEAYGAKLSPLHTGPGSGIPLGWLKRIPPQPELEGADSWEEINTPVML